MDQSKKKKKTIIIVVIVVVILAAIVFGIVACSKALSDSLSQLSAGMTELSTVERRDLSNYISVSGQVESEDLVKVTSTVTAKVKKVNAEIGKEVKAGEVLLEFDSDDLQTQYDNLKKNLENSDNLTAHTHDINVRNLENAKRDKTTSLQQAQRSIDSANNALNKARSTRDDYRNKYNSLLEQINRGDFNEDPLKYEAAQQQLASLEAAFEQADASISSYEDAVQAAKDAYTQTERSCDMQIQSYQDILDNEEYSKDNSGETELKKLADAIKDCTVRAPKSGIITALNVAEGSIPTSEALMTIENKDSLKITVTIAEGDILKIHEGQKAIVKTTATGDQEFNATVKRVVNIVSGGTTDVLGRTSGAGYSAEIVIDDKDTALLIGMTAKVQIILEEKADVLSVPYESIKEDDDGNKYVLLAITDEKNGVTTAKRANVTTGMEGSYFTEIESTEVKEGDKIVMDASAYDDGSVLLVMPNMNSLTDSAAGGESQAEESKAEDEASAE
ncbi:MAG: efflux RND transporter periplasmic adaptor subunit [Oscillospiraceae bacterium]|nr:efflux RND transporter periplasmic adaptor subunit [Oscillospiraceae bacterium]